MPTDFRLIWHETGIDFYHRKKYRNLVNPNQIIFTFFKNLNPKFASLNDRKVQCKNNKQIFGRKILTHILSFLFSTFYLVSNVTCTAVTPLCPADTSFFPQLRHFCCSCTTCAAFASFELQLHHLCCIYATCVVVTLLYAVVTLL